MYAVCKTCLAHDQRAPKLKQSKYPHVTQILHFNYFLGTTKLRPEQHKVNGIKQLNRRKRWCYTKKI